MAEWAPDIIDDKYPSAPADLRRQLLEFRIKKLRRLISEYQGTLAELERELRKRQEASE